MDGLRSWVNVISERGDPAASLGPEDGQVTPTAFELLSSKTSLQVSATTSECADIMIQASRFLSLPLELREEVYSILLHPDANRRCDPRDGTISYHYRYSNLFRVNKQIYDEAKKVFRRLNIFALVETPFPEAEHHIAIEGYVPVVVAGTKAETFKDWHLRVVIDAPGYHFPRPDAYNLVLHADDVASFCKMWFYSALSYPGLNSNLGIHLALQNPYAMSYEDGTLPKALQKKLMAPFGMVKGLKAVTFDGISYESIRQDVLKTMKEPPVSPSQCLEDSSRLKDAGNLALKEKKYQRAISLYLKAFEAMHIICVGHRRSVWADAYFQGTLEGETFKGQQAEMVRLVLRIKLVANIVLAFIKLEDWEEARFWGMRTIHLMRQAMGFSENGEDEEPILGFAAANQMGKIYYRTGLALKHLDDKPEARKLLRIAIQYLPNDEEIKRTVASVALQLG